jgi:hypothetical protein
VPIKQPLPISSSLQPQETTNLLVVSITYLLWIFHVDAVMQYVTFLYLAFFISMSLSTW